MNDLVIFDLDGTLIDTPSGIVEAFQNVFTNMGLKEKDPSEIRNTIGLPLEQAFGNLLGASENDERISEAINLYQEAFKTILLPKAEMLIFPGVLEGLSILQDLKYILAIATSKYYKSADTLLKAAKIRNYFTLVIGADQVSKPKPDKEMGLKIISQLGALTRRTIMVGDTTHDIEMARNLGVHSIAVTYGVHTNERICAAKPTWIANTFYDVVNQIKNYYMNYD